MVDEIREALRALAEKRPVFHSEADFQHALALELQGRHPAWGIRLERPPPGWTERIHLDIWIETPGSCLALELKYGPRKLDAMVGNERFALVDSARDWTCHDLLKDVQRLERVTAEVPRTRGCALMLANDHGYWTPPRSTAITYAASLINEGRQVVGPAELAWAAHTSAGTTKGREEPIHLRGTYVMRWEDYSRPVEDRYGTFRYLLLEVTAPGGQPRHRA